MNQYDEFAKQELGLSYLYPAQSLMVGTLVEAWKNRAPHQDHLKDFLALMPTGSGKSLCFTLPGLYLKTQSLIIFPLKALIDDQYRRFQEMGLSVMKISGSRPLSQIQKEYKKLSRSAFILATPEALLQGQKSQILDSDKIGFIFIDEAHTISQWGTTFRPVLAQLGPLREVFPQSICGAFTATASQAITEDIQQSLFKDRPFGLTAFNPDRQNIAFYALRVLAKMMALDSLILGVPIPFLQEPQQKKLQEHSQGCILIFVSSRNKAELLCHKLRRRHPGREIYYYHAGLDQREKSHVEKAFFISHRGILLATCAYGMGIDKKNIRLVIHYDLPSGIEAYLQEAGRGSRDGMSCSSIVLISPEDHPADYLTRRECRREMLLQHFGFDNTPCSGCDVCSSQKGALTLSDSLISLKKKKLAFLSFQEKLKWLSGVVSPQFPLLSRLASFGLLEKVPREDIKEALRASAKAVSKGHRYYP